MGKTRQANAQNAKAETKVEGVINSRKAHKEKAGKLKTLLTFKGKCAQMKMRFAIEAYTLLMLQVRIYSTKLNYLNMCMELDMN